MPLFSRSRVFGQECSPIVEGHLSPPSLCCPLAPHARAAGQPTSDVGVISLSQHHAEVAQVLQSFIPPDTCRWLSPESITLVDSHPMAAGEHADIWEAIHGGRRVVLKLHRRHATSGVVQVAVRFYNEVRTCGLLHRDDAVVSFVGAYSTETHPFGLIYDYMMGLDLKQYLENEPEAERLKLLTEVARGLSRLHALDIVHGDPRPTNVLVDKEGTPRLSGLGNARVLSLSAAPTAGGGGEAGRLSRSRAPELVGLAESAPGVANPVQPTKASDMYAFGVTAFEVLAGNPPFSKLTEISATYLMLKGDRPPRPDCREVSDAPWRMIDQCWDHEPSQRMTIGEALTILETELRRRYDSQT